MNRLHNVRLMVLIEKRTFHVIGVQHSSKKLMLLLEDLDGHEEVPLEFTPETDSQLIQNILTFLQEAREDKIGILEYPQKQWRIVDQPKRAARAQVPYIG